MKILLAAINAKYIHSNLAVYSLRAYVPGLQAQIEIAEYTINHNQDDILQDLYARKPDILAFSCYIWNIEYVKALAEDLANLLPNTCFWAGGPEVSYDAMDFLKTNPWFGGVMKGEGEASFARVAEYYLRDQGTLEQIAGITYRGATGEIHNNPEQEPVSMDSLVFPYRDLQEFENRILYYESSRGCPFSCSYCLSSIDKKLRFKSLPKVKEELLFFLENKVPQVKFVDRTFNCSHTHALEIWAFLKEHDNGITNFHFEIAADLLNQQELLLLSGLRPGQVQLEIGVQSANPATLKEINRKMDLDKVKAAVAFIRKGKNIHQHLDLIAGLPWEDYKSFQESFGEVFNMKPDQLQLGFLKVLKGSSMHLKSAEYGNSWKKQPQYEILYTDWITYDEICRLKGVEEMVEVFYNSHQFSNTIEYLSGQFPSSFQMFEALSGFYDRYGLRGRNHTRAARFEHLRSFLLEQTTGKKEDMDHYEELLLLDLYLRENAKSRPIWAEGQSYLRERIYDFCKKEEVNPCYLKDYAGFQYKQTSKMVHFEVFHKPVLPGMEEGKVYFTVFDYRKRSPLHQDAAVYLIEEIMDDQKNSSNTQTVG